MANSLIKAEFIYLKQLFSRRTIVSPAPVSNSNKLFLLCTVYLLLNLVVVLLLSWPLNDLFPEIEEAYGAMEDFTELEFTLMAVFLAPPLEEFIFRLPMRYSKRNLRIWLILTALFALPFHWAISLFLFVFWLYWMTSGNNRQFETGIKRFYKRYGVAIFWCFTLLFAAVHISNFSLDKLPVHLYLIAIIPQIVTGVFLGVVRLRLGFWWAMLLHALFNLIVSFLAWG